MTHLQKTEMMIMKVLCFYTAMGYVLHSDGVCSTQDKAGIPRNWIILDNQSTVDVFSNPNLLMNI